MQTNIGRFQHLFGIGNMVVVDNSKDDRELTTIVMSKCSKEVRRLLTNKIKSYTAKRWMAHRKKIKKKMKTFKESIIDIPRRTYA